MIGAQVFQRRGVEKDERARMLEELEIDSLRKDQEDEIRIIRTSAFSKIRELMAGRRAATRVSDERRGVEWLGGGDTITNEVLDEIPDSTPASNCRIACCGPEPMMEAVAEIALARSVSCEVSLESPMACGIGICFSCVVKVRQASGDWDYKRTCVEGPVFDAEKIVW